MRPYLTGDIWIGSVARLPHSSRGTSPEAAIQMHITDKGKRMLAAVTAWETFKAAVDSIPGGWELLGEWFDEDAPAPAGAVDMLAEMSDADGRTVPPYMDPTVVTWDVLLGPTTQQLVHLR
jgi:hypothetical protein